MRARRLLLGLFAGLALACGAVRAAQGDIELIDDLVRQGDETPDSAIRAIGELSNKDLAVTPLLRRAALTGVGIVQARNGRMAEALAQVAALTEFGRTQPLADADAHLVRAEIDVNGGHMASSYQQARAALAIYSESCAPGPRHDIACNYRDWWRALDMAQRGAADQGNAVIANGYAQTMLDVARRNGDRPREAISLGVAALQAEANADPAAANRLIAQAQRVARGDGAAWVQLRVAVLGGLLHFRRQQPEAVQRDYEAALSVANAAGLKRPAMLLRANLADAYIHQGRPGDALAAIDLALPVAKLHHDSRTERLLLHNRALAKLALGRVPEGKAEMTHVLELWQKDTGPGQRQEALHEFGDALGKAGDTAGALELFHLEEALTREIRAANKSAAEAELRARYDQESQKRRIELLGRDNQLKQAELDNQGLARRLWMFAGAALVLLAVLALMMYLRMRELNRTLVEHEALLRAHSERDALTGLANRRQFREVMRVRGGERAFRGALLMVDVDHFKRVNDHHGHAAGDRVLVEVARRLGAAMRADDLVARWGGEEFLVFAPNVEGAELDQLAERVRVAMNQAPVVLDNGTSIETTVSIGYAAFPLPASHVPVTWEQAVNLADLSLYTAKNHGRNCAVGIVRTTAASSEALREVEADIAQARDDGRVTLRVSPEAAAA
ncbi:MAG: GGDEF domain-containing protein [Burkholderiales bacterium]|nr:GGDEF domain-containing protein [Burkholderiales bacterium]